MVRRGKLLITGCHGQLGTDLARLLSAKYELVGTDLPELDITNETAVKELVKLVRPTVIIHSAAYTDVDSCESNRELAMKVNGAGTSNVAKAAASAGARIIYYSTDYVFDGAKNEAYIETDPTNPATVYGQSKLAGEKGVTDATDNCVIMRIAWVYGAYGRNFVRTILDLGRRQLEDRKKGRVQKPLKVVNDQYGNPTWTEEIVAQTAELIEAGASGLFHATSGGETTWYQLAQDIFRLRGMEVEIAPCTTEEFPRPAPRPRMSALDNARLKQLGLNRMKPYIPALDQFLKMYREI